MTGRSMTSHPMLPGAEGTPGLRLDLVDSDDEPLDEGAGGARRPSTASLSRFRSCPQLSSADKHGDNSPGSDEMGLGGSELYVTGTVHFTHGSPRIAQRSHHVDGGGGPRSQTPTPPSTPGSRRSHASLKDTSAGGGGSALARGGAAGMDAGAAAGAATGPPPRSVGRARLEHALLGRASSTDTDPAIRLMDENFLRAQGDGGGSERGSRNLSEFFEEPPDISIDERLTATEDGASTPAGGVAGIGGIGVERHYHGDQDSLDKCARWLQSLKMTSGDRLKSRSHIQLPPI